MQTRGLIRAVLLFSICLCKSGPGGELCPLVFHSLQSKTEDYVDRAFRELARRFPHHLEALRTLGFEPAHFGYSGERADANHLIFWSALRKNPANAPHSPNPETVRVSAKPGAAALEFTAGTRIRTFFADREPGGITSRLSEQRTAELIDALYFKLFARTFSDPTSASPDRIAEGLRPELGHRQILTRAFGEVTVVHDSNGRVIFAQKEISPGVFQILLPSPEALLTTRPDYQFNSTDTLVLTVTKSATGGIRLIEAKALSWTSVTDTLDRQSGLAFTDPAQARAVEIQRLQQQLRDKEAALNALTTNPPKARKGLSGWWNRRADRDAATAHEARVAEAKQETEAIRTQLESLTKAAKNHADRRDFLTPPPDGGTRLIALQTPALREYLRESELVRDPALTTPEFDEVYRLLLRADRAKLTDREAKDFIALLKRSPAEAKKHLVALGSEDLRPAPQFKDLFADVHDTSNDLAPPARDREPASVASLSGTQREYAELRARRQKLERESPHDPDLAVLSAREKKLFAEHHQDWIPERWRKELGARSFQFEGGVIRGVDLNERMTPADVEALFRDIPTLDRLSLRNFSEEAMVQVLQRPVMRRLRRLVIDGSFSSGSARQVRSEQLRALAGIPTLTGVESLRLECLPAVSPRDLQAVVDSPFLSKVREFSMSAAIGDQGVRILTQSRMAENLEQLSLRNADITNTGVETLAGGRLPRLTQLDLSQNHLTDEGARALAAAPFVKNLTKLELSWNAIGDKGVAALLGSPLGRIEILGLSSNGLTDAAVKALAESEKLAHLRSLRLGSNAVTDASARALADSPVLRRVRYLDIYGTQISGTGREALFRSPNFKAGEIFWFLSI